MKSLLLQLKYELKRFNAEENSIETIFIGGGTPSTIKAKLYQPIFKLLKKYIKSNIEITIEANPNSATHKWLNDIYKLGVNRVSFGVQSFNEKKLKLLNRAHNKSQAIDAIKNAHHIGFKNISLDLIYATFGDTKELLNSDLEEAFKLPINHLSAYALTIEEGTPFQKTPNMAIEYLELTQWFFNAIKEKGFQQYEISNFGTYKSKHNLGYWLYKDYIGIGSGAVGKLENRRFYSNSIIEDYINNPTIVKAELLSDEDIKLEKIFLGLRSYIGFEKTILNKHELKQVQILINEGKIYYKEDRFYNKNYLLADEIALFITQ